EQRVKFPKQRRILRPGEVIGLAGFLPNCCSLGFSIRVISHVNFICAVRCRIFCDVIHLIDSTVGALAKQLTGCRAVGSISARNNSLCNPQIAVPGLGVIYVCE
ncbi:hypothetical protein SFRURICE_011667, partial [Spodoptera frugiperda]